MLTAGTGSCHPVEKLPPAARDVQVKQLPHKLVKQLAGQLDNLSSTDLDWRGLFGELQERYTGGLFLTPHIQLYNSEYLKIGESSPTEKLLLDLGKKTRATAQDLYDALTRMNFCSAGDLIYRYFTEPYEDWSTPARKQGVLQLLPDRPQAHDVLLRDKEMNAIALMFKRLQHSDQSSIDCLYVTGPPACGKTELVRQYLESIVNEWLDKNPSGYQPMFMAGTLKAGSVQDFEDSLQKLAQAIGCPRAVEVAVQIKDAGIRLAKLSENVRHRMKTFTEWLLVVDNLTHDTNKAISGHWPEPSTDDWGKGRVLITTSDRRLVKRSNPHVKELKLRHGLEPNESVRLLRLISGCRTEDGAAQLAAQLDYNPLSLASAAWYVKEVGEGPTSWHDYISKLSKNIQDESEQYLAEQQSRTYPNTLQAAIKVALEKMVESNEKLKTALEVIAVCSQRHPLPFYVVRAFLTVYHGTPSKLVEVTIKHCSLVLFSETDDTVRVHSATHYSLNEMWESDTMREHKALVALTTLVQESTILERHEDWVHTKRQQLLLLPHLLHILCNALPYQEGTDVAEAWMLCSNGIDVLGAPCKVGWWLDTDNMLQQQLDCVQKALSLYQNLPSEPHDKVVKAYLQLSDILDDMYKQEKALEYAELAVEQASSLEDAPLLRAQSLKTLGRICTDRGNTERAIHLLQQSKDIYITRCGRESLHVASLLTSLGRTYHDLGENGVAKVHYEKALEICDSVTETQGLQSTSLLEQTFASLGRAYLEPNSVDAEKAIQLLEPCLTMRQRRCGHEHPITALTLTGLGRARLVNQQPHLAEEQLREALRIQQLTLPANHPDMAITLNILGNLQRLVGKYQAAVVFLQQSLNIRQQVFGSDHHDVGYCKNDLAMALLGINRPHDALPLLQEVLHLKIDKFGQHHIEVAITYGCLSDVYRALEDRDNADICLSQHEQIMRQQTDSQLSVAMQNWQ